MYNTLTEQYYKSIPNNLNHYTSVLYIQNYNIKHNNTSNVDTVCPHCNKTHNLLNTHINIIETSHNHTYNTDTLYANTTCPHCNKPFITVISATHTYTYPLYYVQTSLAFINPFIFLYTQYSIILQNINNTNYTNYQLYYCNTPEKLESIATINHILSCLNFNQAYISIIHKHLSILPKHTQKKFLKSIENYYYHRFCTANLSKYISIYTMLDTLLDNYSEYLTSTEISLIKHVSYNIPYHIIFTNPYSYKQPEITNNYYYSN